MRRRMELESINLLACHLPVARKGQNVEILRHPLAMSTVPLLGLLSAGRAKLSRPEVAMIQGRRWTAFGSPNRFAASGKMTKLTIVDSIRLKISEKVLGSAAVFSPQGTSRRLSSDQYLFTKAPDSSKYLYPEKLPKQAILRLHNCNQTSRCKIWPMTAVRRRLISAWLRRSSVVMLRKIVSVLIKLRA